VWISLPGHSLVALHVIAVSAGAITGHAYLKNGGYYDDVYEKIGAGQWRIKSRTYVAAATP
jgi:hypothetical protein